MEKFIKVLFGAGMILLFAGTKVKASEEAYSVPFRIESTAYYEGEVTASGQKVREGICAGKAEWLGLTCIVYADDGGKPGEYIGIYEVLDTGSDSRIQNGSCIDFYMTEENACWEWGRRTIWIQLVDADG